MLFFPMYAWMLRVPSGQVYEDATMVTRTPLVRRIEGPDLEPTVQIPRCEDEVELAGGGRGVREARPVGGDVAAMPWQFLRPRIGLNAVGGLGPDEGKADRLHARKNRFVPSLPVITSPFSVTVEHIEVAGYYHPVLLGRHH